MQNELTALRPQLLETSDETERLMIKIEQDTIQVEAKKEIVACDEALANEAAAAAQAIRYGFYRSPSTSTGRAMVSTES